MKYYGTLRKFIYEMYWDLEIRNNDWKISKNGLSMTSNNPYLLCVLITKIEKLKEAA